jgi:2,3-bisphosphoglycerate-independent phosphoglycerate mutase
MNPVMLVIMDGVGINPRADHNAVAMAKKPFIDRIWREFPVTSIKTSGEDVGLPPDVMGNSEVGHMNIGAGRVVYQPFTLINREIREGRFFSNERILEILERAGGKTLHLMGLLSTGGVHGDVGHVEAILKLCKEKDRKDVAIHAFMDGRDMPPRSGLELIRRIERAVGETGVGRIASVSGRYFAMDRDKRWERTKKAYEVIVDGIGNSFDSAEAAVQASYDRGVTDEFIEPVLIGSEIENQESRIENGDSVFFWNFRPDRARQMTRAIMDPDFKGFERARFPKIHYLGMVQYDEAFTLAIAYPPQNLSNVLADVLARAGKTQFHSAETEKYPHVTFFLNGGVEEPKPGEDRVMIPSPKVATYDLQPEMSAPALTDAVMTALQSKKYDFLIVNYANGDMVGHTGDLAAAIKAVEAVDAGLARIVPELLSQGGAAIVTADHGNCEQMIWYETGEPHTQHTTFEVTLTVLGAGPVMLRSGGRLADIAPTVLGLMNLPKPAEMTGVSLIA